MVAEHNIDTKTLNGSGKGGRVTKEDLVQNMQAAPSHNDSSQIQQTPTTNISHAYQTQRGETRKPMTMIRRRISETLKCTTKRSYLNYL